MSSLCGLVRPGGAAVGDGELAAMLDALDHWRADARWQWTGRGAGLGHLLLQRGPRPDTPGLDEGTGLRVTGDVRLDNRPVLAARLSLGTDLARLSDLQVVLRAYATWGDDCARHLRGDFAFAIWDDRRQRLFCARDVFGVKPLYYQVTNGGTVVFASEIKALLALPFVDRTINETWIGDYLHKVTLDRTDTFYAAIKRLEPGHALAVEAGGVRIWRHSQLQAPPELRLRDEREYVDGFREHLTRAIDRRLETSAVVGAELSGGLDSSGICAIAANRLRARGRDLTTFSQVRPTAPEDAAGTPEDARWAVEQVCASAGITKTCLLSGEGGILTTLEWACRSMDEPPRHLVSLYNDQVYDEASARDVGVLLSGFGGNEGVSALGHTRSAELLLEGRWGDAWREMSAEKHGRTPLSTFVRTAAAVITPPILAVAAHRPMALRRRAYRVSRDGFARKIDMRRRTWQYALDGCLSLRLRPRTIMALNRPGLAQRLEYAQLATSSRRVEYRYPLLDLDLVEFYLSLPSQMKYRQGIDRYVFRASLAGWVPDEVRLASGPRASANPGGVTRRRRDRAALVARFQALAPDNAVFQYVDPHKFASAVATRGGFRRERDTEMLMVLALEHRLRQSAGG